MKGTPFYGSGEEQDKDCNEKGELHKTKSFSSIREKGLMKLVKEETMTGK